MGRERYVIEAIFREGRSHRDVAAAAGVSKAWVTKLVARYRAGGELALEPRSRRPKSCSHATAPDLQDAVLALRRDLDTAGARRRPAHHSPSCFAELGPTLLPWPPSGGSSRASGTDHRATPEAAQELVHPLPSHSAQRDVAKRLHPLAARQRHRRRDPQLSRRPLSPGTRLRRLLHRQRVGRRQQLSHGSRGLRLSGFAPHRQRRCLHGQSAGKSGKVLLESELERLGILYKNSRPYHPQTCGKVERFHQTLKRYLGKPPPAASLAELQLQLDTFRAYYNHHRPHRALNGQTRSWPSTLASRHVPKPLLRHRTSGFDATPWTRQDASPFVT